MARYSCLKLICLIRLDLLTDQWLYIYFQMVYFKWVITSRVYILREPWTQKIIRAWTSHNIIQIFTYFSNRLLFNCTPILFLSSTRYNASFENSLRRKYLYHFSCTHVQNNTTEYTALQLQMNLHFINKSTFCFKMHARTLLLLLCVIHENLHITLSKQTIHHNEEAWLKRFYNISKLPQAQ